jgi:hypothetical protein
VACNVESFQLEGDVLMSDPVSDLSAVDQLREQLTAVVGGELRIRFGPDWDWLSVSEAVTGSMLPLVAAFGDAREAAGQEQGRQKGLNEAFEKVRRVDDGWTSKSERAAIASCAAAVMRLATAPRGSGVSVQPTLGKQP